MEDLIIAVQSKEKEINTASVNKVFKEMLNGAVADVEFELRFNMKNIIKEAK